MAVNHDRAGGRARRFVVPGLSLFFLAACFGSGEASRLDDRTIVPDIRVGLIKADVTEAVLDALLPEGQMRRVDLYLGEGATTCATAVFAGTPDEVIVQWAGAPVFDYPAAATEEHCRELPPFHLPVSVLIRQGGWRTAEGIRIGVTVEELARITDQPVVFSVCGCDFGGRLFQGGPAGMQMLIDWPPAAESSIAVVPRHEDDYAISSDDLAGEGAALFFVSEITVDLQGEP